jgi:CHAD domain-containing protein
MTSPARLLRDSERKLSREIPRALAGDVEGIHQLRVTGRRLRLALSVLPHKPDSKRVTRARRELRSVTRAASASRDLDVSFETFDAHVDATAQPSDETLALLRRLKSARSRSRARTAERLLDTELARMRRDLRAVLAQGVEPAESVSLRMRTRTARIVAGLVTGIAEVADRFDPVALHDLRRSIRRLRYFSDMAEEIFAAPGKATRLFRRMQDELGELHDLHVLATWLGARAEAALKKGQGGFAATAAGEAAWAESVARARHSAWLASAPVARVNEAFNELLAALPVQASANDQVTDVPRISGDRR